MNRAINPFRTAPGSVPPVLAGRDAELSASEAAVALTQAGGAAQPIVFIGLRGMGKTALLREIANRSQRRGAILLYAEAGRESSLAESFRRSLSRAMEELQDLPSRLRSAIAQALESLPVPVYELPGETGTIALESRPRASTDTLVDTLDRLNRTASTHNAFLVVCIDEIQEAPPAELQPLITLIHETAGTHQPMLLFAAGLPSTPRFLHDVRTYTERWRYFEIGLLTPAQSVDALIPPLTERGIAVTPQAREALVELSGGYPFFIQEYASAAWGLRARSDRLDLVDVDAAAIGVTRSLESSLYHHRFQKLTPREVRYVLALYELGPGLHASGDVAASLGAATTDVSSIRSQLVKKEVLFAPMPGLIEFRIPLTQRYIAAHMDELQMRARLDSANGARR